MNILRLTCLLGALLGLSGCPTSPCFNGSTSAPPQQTSVVLVGEEVRLRISPLGQSSCDGDIEAPTPLSLSAEISGPDNLPVSSQATLGSPPSSSATVRFTPEKQGRHHVFAAFDPVGGIQQFDLYAARDRSAEAPVQLLSQPCQSLERTRRGGWACDSTFVRDGVLMESFPGFRLAVSGDVVWAISTTQILRFVDTGTALESTATLNYGPSAIRFVLASADEVVLMHDTTLQRFVFDGTQLTSTGLTNWVPGTGSVGPSNLRGVLLRAGDRLATVAGSVTNGSFITLEICAYQLQAGRFVRTTAACQKIGNEVVGFEPSVLWTASKFTFSDSVNDVRRMEWTGTSLVEQASLPLGTNFRIPLRMPESRNTIVPVILSSIPVVPGRNRPTVPVYSPDRRDLLLELLDTEIPEPNASSGLLWGTPATGGTGQRVRIRPSTP
ncbi:hypothetical protein [Hyalangium gracile]|uniref:hypothetical protein n=1 Tax=Hyalangium gracile TaxID=394092 RepID=UPI001CCF25F6|nr:hypothetical protein [Hyalangium gracile]